MGQPKAVTTPPMTLSPSLRALGTILSISALDSAMVRLTLAWLWGSEAETTVATASTPYPLWQNSRQRSIPLSLGMRPM